MLTEDSTKQALRKNIARTLEERGHSNYWLMKKLNATPGFYRVLNGEALPSVFLAARIAEALEVTLDELLYGVLENVAE